MLLQNISNLYIDNISYHHKTPLILAAENGNLDIVKLLISAGAKVNNFVDANSGTTALMAAIMHVVYNILTCIESYKYC